MKKNLLLFPSERMDNNKKSDRNENMLVRMSRATRESMGFTNTVEIFPTTSNIGDRLKKSMLLEIHQAFASDLTSIKPKVKEEDLLRVGFVTTKTFKTVGGKGPACDLWISDGVEDIPIGADPEFLLFNGPNIVHANNVLSKANPVGSDGAMAELRPEPSLSPEGLVNNIRSLLVNNTESIKPYEWVAGCYYKDNVRDYPVGGHVHIGNPVNMARLELSDRERCFKTINKIIDEYISIPMIKVDGTESGGSRRGKGMWKSFGYFGEMRLCSGRLEHRTLSGMWLTHPVLTAQVFGTIKSVVDEVYKHVADNKFNVEYMFPANFRGVNVWASNFEGWANIPLAKDMGCIKTSGEMAEKLVKSNAREITKPFLNSWYNKIKGLSTYRKYSEHVDGLFDTLSHSQKVLENTEKRLKKTWLENAKFL